MRYMILKNGETVNTIVSDESFITGYCEKHDYIYEEINVPSAPEPTPEPSQLDRVEAQAVYTAMMTDTLLEG